MFSRKEKSLIAAAIEKVLLDLNHPEMPKEKPMFELHVDGAEPWSWADIKPNWVYGDAAVENAKTGGAKKPEWNETAREIMGEKQ